MTQSDNEPAGGRRRERSSESATERQGEQDRSQTSRGQSEPGPYSQPAETQARLEAAYHSYLNYLRALDEAWLPASVRDSGREAARACQRAMGEAFDPDQTQRRFEAVHRAYLDAAVVRPAWTDEALKEAAETQKRYMAAVQEAYAPRQVTETYGQAAEAYQKALQSAWAPDEAQKRFEAAYHAHLTYVRALYEAWLPDEVRRRFETAVAQSA
jgi:hypothetical protein